MAAWSIVEQLKRDIHVSELPVLSVELWGEAESLDDLDHDLRPLPLPAAADAAPACGVTGDGILKHNSGQRTSILCAGDNCSASLGILLLFFSKDLMWFGEINRCSLA